MKNRVSVRRTSFLLLSLFCLSLFFLNAAQARGWAVLVGIDKYNNQNISTLYGAVNDAKSLAGVIGTMFKLPEDNILVYTSDANESERLPTKGNIVNALKVIAQNAREDDLFVFAFSGHGVGQEKGYLFTYYTDSKAVEDTGFGLKRINDLVENIPSRKKLLIVDACRNYPEAGKGDGDNLLTEAFARSIVRNPDSNSAPRAATKAVLFSCEIGERAFEWKTKQRGFFSWYLEKGLKGAATDADGRVTLGSLVNYLGQEVPSKVQLVMGTQKSQHPFVSLEGGNPTSWVLVNSPDAVWAKKEEQKRSEVKKLSPEVFVSARLYKIVQGQNGTVELKWEAKAWKTNEDGAHLAKLRKVQFYIDPITRLATLVTRTGTVYVGVEEHSPEQFKLGYRLNTYLSSLYQVRSPYDPNL